MVAVRHDLPFLDLRSHIEVRPAVGRDIDRIVEIEVSAFKRDAWERELFVGMLDECPDLFLVAKLGRRIAGYSITCVQRDKAELVSIAVFPRARLHGVGDALMRRTRQELTRRRVRAWRLMVRIDNEGAIRFYRGFGFRRVRTVKDYYGAGKDAWGMELILW